MLACLGVCVCVCVCQRKTKDRVDGMREKSAHSPRRDSNLYLWDTCVCACTYVCVVCIPSSVSDDELIGADREKDRASHLMIRHVY